MEAARDYFRVDISQHRRLSPTAAGASIAVCFVIVAAAMIVLSIELSWSIALPLSILLAALAITFSMVMLFLADKMSENGLIRVVLSLWDKLSQRLLRWKSTESSQDVNNS